MHLSRLVSSLGAFRSEMFIFFVTWLGLTRSGSSSSSPDPSFLFLASASFFFSALRSARDNSGLASPSDDSSSDDSSSPSSSSSDSSSDSSSMPSARLREGSHSDQMIVLPLRIARPLVPAVCTPVAVVKAHIFTVNGSV